MVSVGFRANKTLHATATASPFADGPENSNVGSAADAPFPVAVRELCVSPENGLATARGCGTV
jgi:hypothetical protein